MGKAFSNYKKDILQEIDGMPSGKLKEVLNFVYFIKTKEVIDPTQSYFWTRKWQKGEEEADKDKKSGRVVGDGSVKDLVRALRS
ncbi:MAG: hypothetical protein CVU74_07330 [Deltaproteobacteria bacterium HGW-Deltaproteobacteria-9]|nr:MAG: hypothetical protein CVU74_07330 [Deltaproteobacteria bacterium HGW-Deltaproteobacteria-9]